MTAAQGIMARASEVIGRAVAAAGSVVYAAAGSVLGSPPVPPVVTWPRVVWVVAYPGGGKAPTVWSKESSAFWEAKRASRSRMEYACVNRCEVRT